VDRGVTSPDAHDVPNLRDLIDRFTDRTGRSRRWIGENSTISHQTLGYWYAGNIKTFPDPGTLREFARVAGVSEQTVVLAAAKSLGLEVEGGGGLTSALPPAADRLSHGQVAALAQLIRAFTSETDRPQLSDKTLSAMIHTGDGDEDARVLLMSAARRAQRGADADLQRERPAAYEGDPELSDPDGEVHPS
jgi:hypothetical protein